MRVQIFAEIDRERDRQIERWGNAFDDTHTPADWWTIVAFIFTKHLVSWKITKKRPHAFDKALLRQGLIKVGATVIAWIEQLDRSN